MNGVRIVAYLVELILLPIELASGLDVSAGYSYAFLEVANHWLGAGLTVSWCTPVIHVSAELSLRVLVVIWEEDEVANDLLTTLRPGVGTREHGGNLLIAWRRLLIRDISLGRADVGICVYLQLAPWPRTCNKSIEDVIWNRMLDLFRDYLHIAMRCPKASVIFCKAMLI